MHRTRRHHVVDALLLLRFGVTGKWCIQVAAVYVCVLLSYSNYIYCVMAQLAQQGYGLSHVGIDP